jgi:hypothetical protein
MPQIRCKHNHGFYTLASAGDHGTVNALTKGGDYKPIRFAGFISSGTAKGILGKTVRLQVWGYTPHNAPPWVQLAENEYVLGYLTHALTVYVCLDNRGVPFIAKKDVLI